MALIAILYAGFVPDMVGLSLQTQKVEKIAFQLLSWNSLWPDNPSRPFQSHHYTQQGYKRSNYEAHLDDHLPVGILYAHHGHDDGATLPPCHGYGEL